jgi:hypothetical protein
MAFFGLAEADSPKSPYAGIDRMRFARAQQFGEIGKFQELHR